MVLCRFGARFIRDENNSNKYMVFDTHITYWSCFNPYHHHDFLIHHCESSKIWYHHHIPCMSHMTTLALAGSYRAWVYLEMGILHPMMLEFPWHGMIMKHGILPIFHARNAAAPLRNVVG